MGGGVVTMAMTRLELNARYLSVLQSVKISMKWYDCLVKILIPFWMIFGAAKTFTDVVTVMQQYYDDNFWSYLADPQLFVINIIAFALPVFDILMMFLIREEMKAFEKTLIQHLLLYASVNVVAVTVQCFAMLIVVGPETPIVSEIFSTYITQCILYIPHYFYFKKRKHLFVFGSETYSDTTNGYYNIQHPYDDFSKTDTTPINVTQADEFNIPPDLVDPPFFVDPLACPKCGTHNDEDYKHCKECGAKRKKENNHSVQKFSKKNALAISVCLCTLCLFGNIIQYANYQAVSSELANKINEYDLLWKKNMTKKEALDELQLDFSNERNAYLNLKNSAKTWQEKANFLDEYVVFTTTTGNKYHKYDCYHLSGDYYYWRLIEATRSGYTPCKDCH